MSAEIRVAGNSLKLLYSRRTMFRVDKRKGLYGKFGFIRLLHSGPEERALFDALFERTVAGVSRPRAIEEVFGPHGYGELEQDFTAYLDELLVR